LIGVVSYLLINYYYTRIQANKAAILALTMNRVGDMGLSIGFFAIFALFGSVDYATIFSLAPFMNETAITIISLLLLMGAMAKSAQIPLHSWLPGSMEAGSITLKLKAYPNSSTIFLTKSIFSILILLIILFIYSEEIILSLKLLDYFYNLYNYFIVNDYSLLENYYSQILLTNIAPILPIKFFRDEKGRFTSKTDKTEIIVPLPSEVLNPLVGNLLGDGHLRFNKKGPNGQPKPNTNAWYAMTLKNQEYIMHLWSNIYYPICTKTLPFPWPSPKSGLPARQYYFHSRALPQISSLHKLWYVWSDELNKFIKIVPLNIGELLTPIGLAHWIMDDGYKNGRGLVLCTDSFTLSEVNLLIDVLKLNFGLDAKIYNRRQKDKPLCWRIAIKGDSDNVKKLTEIVLPYFVPSMYYKLDLEDL
jgi:hypothetical protein